MRRVGFVGVLCLGSIATAQAPRIRDSVGVRIVENPSRLKAPIVFQLGDKPTFHFGGLQTDPADELDARNGYVRTAILSDGRILLADKTRLLMFDRAGKRVASMGRVGQGPGEFTQITDICIARGDTILAGQGRGKPVAIFSKDGKFVSAIPVAEHGYTERPFCFEDGSVFVLKQVAGSYTEATTFEYSRVTPGGAVNRLTRVDYPAFDPLINTPSSILASGDQLYVAMGTTFDIPTYGMDGRLRSIIRTNDPLVKITEAERAKQPVAAFRMGSTEAQKEEQRQRALQRSKTVHWPTFATLTFDASGRMWVQDWRPGGQRDSAMLWTAFDREGRLIGKLSIQAKVGATYRQVVGFGRDEVFLRTSDDDGAAHVTAYPILSIKK